MAVWLGLAGGGFLEDRCARICFMWHMGRRVSGHGWVVKIWEVRVKISALTSLMSE